MDKTQAIKIIRESGLSQYADVLIKHLQPSARLVVQEGSENSLQGSMISRFGGLPMLPQGVDWPVWDRRINFEKQLARLEERTKANPGTTKFIRRITRLREALSRAVMPLSFLAQLNLAEIHSVVQLPGWPREGTLAFFFEPTGDVWGFDPDIRGYFKVLYFPAEQKLYPATAPKSHPEFVEFPEHKVSIRCEWTLPSRIQLGEDDRSLNDAFVSLYKQLIDAGDSNSVFHRAGGHPQEVQGAMQLKCQLVTNGLYCGNASGYEDPRRVELEKGADDWRLLLQVDSDSERAGWEWGDVGRVYFWARQQDIEAGEFGSGWAILQCH